MKTFGILLIAGLLFLAACTTTATTPTGNVAQEPSGQSGSQMSQADNAPSDAQIVRVSVSGGNYIFSPNKVSVNKPVQLVFNVNQLPGCSRSVMVPDYNQRKVITQTDNTIVFTPTKTGEVYVACTMNMYTGTLMVE